MSSSRAGGSPFKPASMMRAPSNLSQRSDGDGPGHTAADRASSSSAADDVDDEDDPLAGLEMVRQGSSSSSSSGERVMTVDQLEVCGRCV